MFSVLSVIRSTTSNMFALFLYFYSTFFIYCSFFFFFFFFLYFFLLFFFFFFQAEDGIRDRNVTGVQTCALPISICKIIICKAHLTRYIYYYSLPGTCTYCIPAVDGTLPNTLFIALLCCLFRSEERRVGKECRSRLAPYQ